MNRLVFLVFIAVSGLLSAQNGKLAGKIVDIDYDREPVAFASVQLKGTTMGAQSDMDGNYSISAPAGTYTVIFSFVGMKTVEIPNVKITKGNTTTLNAEMTAETNSLGTIELVVTKTRESKEALIEEKKKEVTMTQAIGAEELSIKGISNAEAAVTKVSGVSKQAGVKNVFVRGLGDRYNSTTLNGLPLPSDDPEYKNISLDFFGSDLIESVDINKVFTAGITGDNAGANINIDLKGLTDRQALSVGVSTGVNMQTIGNEFKGIQGESFFGHSDSKLPVTNLNTYSFNNPLAPSQENNLVNVGLSINGGKRIDFAKSKLNLYGLVTFDNGYRFVEGTVRNTTSAGAIYLDQDFKSYEYETSQIGQLNADYRFGKNNIEVLSMYIHKNTQDYQDYEGIDNPEQDGDRVFVNRQQTNDSNLFVNQLLTNLYLTNKISVHAGASFNALRGSEPDRRNFQYLFRDGFYSPNLDSGGNNQRYFSTVQENNTNFKANIKYDFNGGNENVDLLDNYINVGGDFKYTFHVFQATIFNHTFDNRFAIDIDNPDAIYNQQSLNAGTFRLETGRGSAINPAVFNPFYYFGNNNTFAGNVNYVKGLTEKLLISGGLRYENVSQEVEYDTNIANSRLNGPSIINDGLFLPSLNVKYTVNDKNIVRLSSSLTYILPRFKEIAPFRYDNPGGTATQGNPNLVISNVLNIDAAYEFYPKRGELISITGFYKSISDPIVRTEIPSGGNTLTYLNIGRDFNGDTFGSQTTTATVLGLELELRKDVYESTLVTIDDTARSSKLSLGLNGSYIYSRVDLDQQGLAQFTASSTALQGASPILVNFDVNYNTFIGKNNLNTALVASYFSERVYSVGTRGFENITEIGVPTLDFISSLKVGDGGKFSFKARNLLNPTYKLEREGFTAGNNVELSQYKRGLDISLGYSYQF